MTDIEPIIKKMVVNAVTGTPGQSAFKERELRQRLVPELVAAVKAEVGERMRDAVAELRDADDERRALWVEALAIGVLGKAYGGK